MQALAPEIHHIRAQKDKHATETAAKAQRAHLDAYVGPLLKEHNKALNDQLQTHLSSLTSDVQQLIEKKQDVPASAITEMRVGCSLFTLAPKLSLLPRSRSHQKTATHHLTQASFLLAQSLQQL